ncbi:MAG: DNA repair protein RadC [Bacteroidia bacterium]|nr:DNA repair protein RadC [Bacteroidia bacterium]
MALKDWPTEDKPREKLIANGSTFLTNAELLSILLGSGSREKTALDLSKQVLSATGNKLHGLLSMSRNELLKFKGIGEAKAVTILAAIELGRRMRSEPIDKKYAVHESHSAYQILHPKIGHLPHEEFWILYLNNSNTLICSELLSKGGITGTLVDIRLVLKKALEYGAVGLIVAHNHPSNQLKPSKADLDLTQKITKAARSIDIKLLDHLIITETSYFSFADENLI